MNLIPLNVIVLQKLYFIREIWRLISPNVSLVQSDLVLGQLPNAHVLMFNPYTDDRLVVTNNPGYDFWQKLKQPRILGSFQKQNNHISDVLAPKLYDLGLLRPNDSLEINLTETNPKRYLSGCT